MADEMMDGSKSWDDLLLDLHLGRLDAEQAAEVEQAIASSPDLADKSRGLRELLHLLDADTVDTPAGLAGRVMARIEGRDRVIPMPEAALASGQELRSRGFSFAWRDLVAVAACVVLFFSVAVPGFSKAQHASRRSRCLTNLRTISNASMLYAEAHGGYLPYANHIAGGSWLPTSDPAVSAAPNSRHVFTLARRGYVPNMQVFICAADRNGRPMGPCELRVLENFPQLNNNSYSFLFMNTPQGVRLQALQPGMVLMADRSPLMPKVSERVHVIVQPDASNSPLHERGAGQNAVHADGHGGWYTRPTIGIDSDDIYRAGQIDLYQGTEAPVAATDILLPP